MDALVEAIKRDYVSAPIAPNEKALLDFALKLTRAPAACTEVDIFRLREVGWSDGAIHDLTVVVSYFAFVNRIASGLGVQLEERWSISG